MLQTLASSGMLFVQGVGTLGTDIFTGEAGASRTSPTVLGIADPAAGSEPVIYVSAASSAASACQQFACCGSGCVLLSALSESEPLQCHVVAPCSAILPSIPRARPLTCMQNGVYCSGGGGEGYAGGASGGAVVLAEGCNGGGGSGGVWYMNPLYVPLPWTNYGLSAPSNGNTPRPGPNPAFNGSVSVTFYAPPSPSITPSPSMTSSVSGSASATASSTPMPSVSGSFD